MKGMKRLNINKWLDKIRDGNKEAFKDFYNAYAPSAIRTAISITKNEEIAKDAVQETFIRVYRQIDSYQPERPFAPWFYRILINECMRVLKRESSIRRISDIELENNRIHSVDSFDELSILHDTIQSLSDIHRIPIILKYVEGLTEKEIAEALDLNQNTVKSRLYKGRLTLKKLLDDSEREGF